MASQKGGSMMTNILVPLGLLGLRKYFTKKQKKTVNKKRKLKKTLKNKKGKKTRGKK